MPAPSRYADTIWHFSLGLTSKTRGGVTCSVFSSEDQFFQGGDPTNEKNRFERAFFSLPSNLLPPQRSPQAPWTKSRPPGHVAAALGKDLWNAMPDVARKSVLDVGARQGRPLRLKITTNTPTLEDLPWEWLSDGAGPPFALRPDMRVVRTLPQLFPTPALTVKKPIRVMLVVANPKDERHLRTGEEIEAVRGRLRAPDYELDVVTVPTLESLLERLQQWMPNVMHYIGHAGMTGGEGNLILHDAQGVSHWVNPATVAQALPASARLLCLSTCVTTENYQILGLPHFAQAPKELPLPTMVVNQYPLGMESVPAFWDTFYDTLLSADGDVNEAVHRGRLAVAARSPDWADWGSFRAVLRDREGIVFRTVAERSATTFAAQIQAQFASRLANELADEVRTRGAHASEETRQRLDRVTKTFTDLSRDLP
jgi:hypothetical protein